MLECVSLRGESAEQNKFSTTIVYNSRKRGNIVLKIKKLIYKLTVDTIITRGQNCMCPNNVGIMSVVKCRRGEPNTRSYSIRLNNGRFMTDLPKSLYDDLVQQREKIFYTEADINQMKKQYEHQEHQIKVELGQNFSNAVAAMNSTPSQINKANNPFRK